MRCNGKEKKRKDEEIINIKRKVVQALLEVANKVFHFDILNLLESRNQQPHLCTNLKVQNKKKDKKHV